jgi:hypothetical protein
VGSVPDKAIRGAVPVDPEGGWIERLKLAVVETDKETFGWTLAFADLDPKRSIWRVLHIDIPSVAADLNKVAPIFVLAQVR